MNLITGATMQKLDPVAGELNRLEPAAPVRGKGTGESGGRKIGMPAHQDQGFINLQNIGKEEKEALQEELNKHNEEFAYTGKFLKFKYDDEAAMVYVEVVDTASQEVIVSLPPEFLIDLSIKLKKIVGLYIDEKL